MLQTTDSAPDTLASIIEAVTRREAEGPRGQPELRIAVLRNYTVEAMVPLLKHQCFQNGFQPRITVGAYDNILQDILNPASHLYAEAPDVIVISWLLEHLDPRCGRADWDEATAARLVENALTQLSQRTTARIVVSTFVPPFHAEDTFGALIRPSHRVSRIRALNDLIRQLAQAKMDQISVIDAERLVALVGERHAIDYRFWYMFRSPFKKDFVAAYAEEVVRIGSAVKGRTKKCLVLDCDNTLWGGVVGEDGVEGIRLDPNEFPGKCYYDFQQSVVNLIANGVIVALCSKNNEDDVWEVLDRHPHCLLKREHIAAWRINWVNKADNIRELAKELNLGTDSFVFVDDSSAECQLIRDAHPEVQVLQVPVTPFDLPRVLHVHRVFDQLAVTDEDRVRAQLYVTARQREESKRDYVDMDAYLASLDLFASVHRVRATEMARVAQLIGKTNQFNLTTRRYSEPQVRELAADDDAAVYTLSAGDKYGELGLVGVLIARRAGDRATIDTLLVSCRALGRTLEHAFVHCCFEELEREWRVATWHAQYVATKKNRQVESFWETVGFECASAADGRKEYVMATDRRVRPDLRFITLQP